MQWHLLPMQPLRLRAGGGDAGDLPDSKRFLQPRDTLSAFSIPWEHDLIIWIILDTGTALKTIQLNRFTTIKGGLCKRNHRLGLSIDHVQHCSIGRSLSELIRNGQREGILPFCFNARSL